MTYRHSIIEKCHDAMLDAMYSAKCNDYYAVDAEAVVYCRDGCIALGCDAYDKWAVVEHDDDEKKSPVLESAISDALPEWSEIEPPYGNPYGGQALDEGFSSWEDYYNWKH